MCKAMMIRPPDARFLFAIGEQTKNPNGYMDTGGKNQLHTIYNTLLSGSTSVACNSADVTSLRPAGLET